MKSIVIISTSLLLLNSPAYIQASELIISNKIIIKHPPANQIAHSGELIIFKYKNWSYTHEVISPENFIASVDLTGTEHQFIKGIFEKKEREKLPSWLAVLAEDFANKIISNNEKHQKFSVGDSTIYGVYNSEEQHGFIFILEENLIHKLDVLGTNKNHSDFIKNIIKRN